MSVRPARLPGDEAAIHRFVLALQHHEAGFESNRRLDDAYLADHWAVVQARAQNGIILVAEENGAAIGWALVHDEPGEMYMAEAERRHGFLGELYVEPAARGRGHGKALIAACEAWSKSRGHKVLMIGVLAQNSGAIRAYEGAGFTPYNLILRKYL